MINKCSLFVQTVLDFVHFKESLFKRYCVRKYSRTQGLGYFFRKLGKFMTVTKKQDIHVCPSIQFRLPLSVKIFNVLQLVLGRIWFCALILDFDEK